MVSFQWWSFTVVPHDDLCLFPVVCLFIMALLYSYVPLWRMQSLNESQDAYLGG